MALRLCHTGKTSSFVITNIDICLFSKSKTHPMCMWLKADPIVLRTIHHKLKEIDLLKLFGMRLLK